MRKESLPYNYNLRKRFRNMRRLKVFEGGAIFAAEKNGTFYLIVDERSMGEFILPDDDDLLDKMLTVLEFDSEEERDRYMRDRK